MTVHQLPYRCWVTRDPASEYQPHYRDGATALAEVAEAKADDPETKVAATQEGTPCWVAICDGRDCGELYTDDEEGASHFPGAQVLMEWAAGEGWAFKTPDLAYCRDDRPEDPDPVPLSPAEQEAAGQLRFPGVIP